MKKGFGWYALAVVAVVSVTGWLMTLAFDGPRDASAIALSAIVTAVVQCAAFAVTRLLAPKGIVAAWGAGSLLRFLTLIVYTLVVVKVLDVPPIPALIGMAAFFVITTLIEPLFLRL